MRIFLACFAVTVACSAGTGEEILAAYEAARPAGRDLGVFQLDWADSFKDARARAAKEKRPIFLVCTTQLKEAGNLREGHC